MVLKFRKTDTKSNPATDQEQQEPNVPTGLWVKCSKCNDMVYKEDVQNHYHICPKCGGYFRMSARNRIRAVVDAGSFKEWDKDVVGGDPLQFPGYQEKIDATREKTSLGDAVITGKGTIHGTPVVLCVMDGRFFMGSMGYAVGEKITLAVERATKHKLPIVIFSCSGGARMQEGMISLMQMGKTSAALKRHSDAGLFYLSVLTDPTTGGVTASFAMLGDLILAEPKALVGFAGPRVIRQTIGEELPEGFQRAEFLVEHGLIDGLVKREELKETLSFYLKVHERPDSETLFKKKHTDRKFLEGLGVQEKSPWERVEEARSQNRPEALSFVRGLFSQFHEIHGDRAFREDGSIVTGIAYFKNQPVTVIAQEKGKSMKENLIRNFGMPYPEGYRKALRAMKEAEKFHRPIVAIIDTPGAFCGIEAEERGQGEAIARCLYEMSGLQVPVLSIVIGEGGSGGALALGMGNEVWMLENATYSVLSPEGFASILWKDGKRAAQAAEVMKMTGKELFDLEIVDRIIYEQETLTQETLEPVLEQIEYHLYEFMRKYTKMDAQAIVNQRYKRFRDF